MFQKFAVKTWDGSTVRMTAEELRDRIKTDCKRDYGWIAAASDLVRVTSAKRFPEDIAYEIKDTILNCFANLAVKRIYHESNRKKHDAKAVWQCYIDSKDKALKKRFIDETIRAVILLEYGDDGLPFHSGPKHDKFEKEFAIEMSDDLKHLEIYSERELYPKNYIEWEKGLQRKYHDAYKKASEEGLLKGETIQSGLFSGTMNHFKIVNADFKEINLNS